MGNEGGVHGLRGGAGRLDASGAKQRSEQRGGAGQGLAAVAGRAVSAGGGSPPHVWTANDGPLQKTGQLYGSRHTALGPGGHNRKKIIKGISMQHL